MNFIIKFLLFLSFHKFIRKKPKKIINEIFIKNINQKINI